MCQEGYHAHPLGHPGLRVLPGFTTTVSEQGYNSAAVGHSWRGFLCSWQPSKLIPCQHQETHATSGLSVHIPFWFLQHQPGTKTFPSPNKFIFPYCKSSNTVYPITSPLSKLDIYDKHHYFICDTFEWLRIFCPHFGAHVTPTQAGNIVLPAHSFS